MEASRERVGEVQDNGKKARRKGVENIGRCVDKKEGK